MSELKGVIGLMVQFEAEDSDNPLTSGNGQFLIADVCIVDDCSNPDNLQEGIDFIEHNGTNGFQGIDIGFIDNDDITFSVADNMGQTSPDTPQTVFPFSVNLITLK